MQLAPESAFEAGADLWIVPERKNSKLAQTLDWYLNFQISKSVHHESPHLAAPLIDVLKNCELEGYDFAPQDSDALLILSSRTVPSRWVMVIKGSDRLESWIEKAVEKWKKMSSPSVRVFLPSGTLVSDFEKQWKKSGGDPQKLTTVADQGSSNNG